MEEIRKTLEAAIQELFDVRQEVVVTVAPENTGADYATNVALQLAKVVHRNPMVIAEQLADSFSPTITSSDSPVRSHRMSNTAPLRASNLPSTSSGMTSSRETENGSKAGFWEGWKIEVAAPGFLNFISPDEYFSEKIAKFAEKSGNFEKNISPDEYSYAGKTVVAEFSDPNPFKVLHVGHLYTSVVGDSISRLLECAGAKVVRANFGGDVGLHVAKTLYAVEKHLSFSGSVALSESNPLRGRDSDPRQPGNNPQTTNASRPADTHADASVDVAPFMTEMPKSATHEEAVKNLTIEEIARAYVEGTRAYEEDEQAKAEITELNKEIYRINAEDDHEGALAQLYWRGRELSYEYFDEFYAKIGVKFDKYYPESSVAGRGLAEVRAHTGTTYEESDGAVVYRGEKVGLHTRVFINAQGVPTYEAKDVGLIFTKWDDWKFDESVVVTGNEQSDYMKVVLASVSEYAPQLVERTTHLTHGLVKLPGNVKMSSRKGNFLKAVDVLELVEAQLERDAATDGIADHSKRSSEGSDRWKVVLAAIKYAFLKYKMGGDIVFDPQESVSTTGNSGVYLLYAAVRARKILQKSQASAKEAPAAQDEETVRAENVAVRSLSKKIVQYTDVLKEAVAEKAPYKVCTYLYELAQEFSRFYERVRVAGNAREAELIEVVRAYANVMGHGLGLLGIEIPKEM